MRHPAFNRSGCRGRTKRRNGPREPTPLIRYCGCEQACGMSFRPTRGRQFHPHCPNRREGWLRFRDKGLLLHGPNPHRRCPRCEDMPHRRRKPVCPACGQAYVAEVIESDRSPVGCALASLL